jgi:TolA-binding protein
MGSHRSQYPVSGVSRKRIEKCPIIGHNEEAVDDYMNPKVKLAAYAVLLILAVWFGLAFRSNYAEVTNAADSENSENAVPRSLAKNKVAPATASTNTVTNLAVQVTNAAGEVTNTTAEVTNASVDATNASGDITNATGDVTNSSAAVTNAATTAPPPRARAPKPGVIPVAVDVSLARSAMIRYLGGFIAAMIGLGVLVAIDVTQYFGSQVSDYLFLDVGDAMRDPLYERAEAAWANGTYLEAVQLLRDYLTHNPRELHAALRIAEIYEKDLKNYLAAVLEYEEVLKHKLPAERWGWAAIHLCNLYSRMNEHDKTRALLHRIVQEYPKTAAARKARGRLGLAEPEDEAATAESVETAEETVAPPIDDEPEAPPSPPPPSPEPDKPHLPPGFRPKK